MLTIRRRTVLAGGAAASGVGLLGKANAKPAAQQQTLVVYAPSIPQAHALAHKETQGPARMLPVQGDVVEFWKKKLASHKCAVKGYTSWSDYVVLRGLAEEKGLRLRAETQLRVAAGKTLFAWAMA